MNDSRNTDLSHGIVVKGSLNFVAGRLSGRLGRKRVLFRDWLAAVPIPLMIWYAPSWSWIVAATVLLGVNQGFTRSMTQTSELDLARGDQRGFAIGIYRFWRDFGYAVGALLLGVAAAVSGALEITFWRVGGAMFASGLLVRLFSEETLPRLNPALQ